MSAERHTAEELNDVALRAQAGDQVASARLAELMRPYVKAFVKRIKGDYTLDERRELEQAGYLGVYEALVKFDPNRGAKFSTFAWLYIKDNIMAWLGANSGALSIPKTAWKYARYIERELYHLDPTRHPTEFTDEETAALGPYGNLAYAGDVFRARTVPYQIRGTDGDPAPALEDELFEPMDGGRKRPGISPDQEYAALRFVESLHELEPDERWQAAEQFVEDQGLPPEVAQNILEVADL